jgi:hypothetical protein
VLLRTCAAFFGYSNDEEEPPQHLEDGVRYSAKHSKAIASALRKALREIPKTDRTGDAYDEASVALTEQEADLSAPPQRLRLDYLQLPLLVRSYLIGVGLSREFFCNLLSGPNRKVVVDFVAFLERGEHFVTTVCCDCAEHRLSLQ